MKTTDVSTSRFINEVPYNDTPCSVEAVDLQQVYHMNEDSISGNIQMSSETVHSLEELQHLVQYLSDQQIAMQQRIDHLHAELQQEKEGRIQAENELHAVEAKKIERQSLIITRKLTGLIAHEVNTPLQSILIALDLVPRVKRLERAALLCQAQSEIKRIGTILHQFQEIYTVYDAPPHKVDLNRVIARTLQLIKSGIYDHHVQVECHLEPKLPHMLVQSSQITHMLLLLISYVIHSMPDERNLCIESKVNTENYLLFEIHIDRIRTEPDTAQQRLLANILCEASEPEPDLSICQHIIERHNGTVTVLRYSNESVGFVVSLPSHP